MAVEQFKARDYQELMIDHIIENPRSNVWAGMGLGKTVSVLTAADIMALAGEITWPILVLAPKRVARTTWPDEVKKWAHTRHLTVSVVIGNERQRCEALKRKADIYTINYDNIPWLTKKLEGQDWPFSMIVADESTKLKGLRISWRVHPKSGKRYLAGQGAQRAGKLARVAFKSPRFVNLTGTPSPNGLKDLWGQNWFIDAGERLGNSYTAFTERWFQRSFDGYSIDPLPFAQEQMQALLEDVTLALDPADYFDLKEPIENFIYVDLPSKAQRLYDEMEEQMYTELNQLDTVEAVNAAARTQKCLQLANGSVYVDGKEKEWREVHDVKIEALEDVIEEAAGMPVMVSYYFRPDLIRLKKHFKKARVLDDDPKTQEDWNKGKIPILLAHPASAGHGLNLQYGSNILCFYSINWNLEHHEQIQERIGPVRQAQAGFERPVFHHYIMARGTIEDLVLQRLQKKASIQELLIDAMKEKKYV